MSTNLDKHITLQQFLRDYIRVQFKESIPVEKQVTFDSSNTKNLYRDMNVSGVSFWVRRSVWNGTQGDISHPDIYAFGAMSDEQEAKWFHGVGRYNKDNEPSPPSLISIGDCYHHWGGRTRDQYEEYVLPVPLPPVPDDTLKSLISDLQEELTK